MRFLTKVTALAIDSLHYLPNKLAANAPSKIVNELSKFLASTDIEVASIQGSDVVSTQQDSSRGEQIMQSMGQPVKTVTEADKNMQSELHLFELAGKKIGVIKDAIHRPGIGSYYHYQIVRNKQDKTI
jgi:hypothetical protein